VTLGVAESGGGRTPSPQGHARPPDGYDSWDDYMADIELAESFWRDEQTQRGLKAVQLAPSLAVCRALLAGQHVPVSQLDQRWRSRYGL
jgi:hypothetical protein